MRSSHPLNNGMTADSALIRSLRGERVSPLPVWFMRQAGRSLPEYRKLREGTTMLESCLTPDLVVEITLQPVRRHGVDAAIFFSDIVIPLKLAGVGVEIQAGIGPVIDRPVRDWDGFRELKPLEQAALAPIVESVERLSTELEKTPLIGFGGAPFTLASYLIEGGPSKDLPHSRRIMAEDPELWAAILTWCADVTAVFIRAQVEAGASALQVFDSWAGKLSREEYLQFAAPHSTSLFDQLKDLQDSSGLPVPRIHFGVGTKEILQDMFDCGATVMGIDSDTDLSEAAELLPGVALQGNIDTNLLSDWQALAENVKHVITSGAAAPGHVVNLGHGVPKDTDPEVLTRLVRLIHDLSK
jgi:uroporphyrinogen decarboxylase